MPVRVVCPSCATQLNVRDEHAGRPVRCPKCGFMIPPADAAAPPAPPRPAFEIDEPRPAPHATSRPPRDSGDDDDDGDRRRRPRPPRRNDDDDDNDRKSQRSGRGRPARGGGLGDYLAFRKMVVPVVIQIIFWFLAILVIGAGLVFGVMSILTGRTQAILVGIAAVVIGVPLYLLLIRMYCEVLIVVFRMNDTLTDIRNLLEKKND